MVQNTQWMKFNISLAGEDSLNLAVSWNTKDVSETSTVKYGLNAGGPYISEATGSSVQYWESYNHHVVLNGGLEQGKRYYYIVGDEKQGFSKEFSFKAPLNSKSLRSFSFAAFADLGVYNGNPSTKYVETIMNDIDLVWHGGDVGYADDSFLHNGCYTQFCYEDAFDNYMNAIEPWASHLPYMVAVGNHEADCHSPNCIFSKEKREKLSNFTAYNARFRMPSQESGGKLNMHYSFDYGNAHFISIDTETGYEGAAEEDRYVFPCGGFGDQLTWLENDLIEANKNRAERPWIFAQGHHPMYQGDSVNKNFQAAMEDLFYKYGVDVYFSGHVHSYERDLPVYREKVYNESNPYFQPPYPMYVMIGGSGNDEMSDIQRKLLADEKGTKPNFVDIATTVGDHAKGSKWKGNDGIGPWTAVVDRDDHVGIGKVTIKDDNSLTFEYIRTKTREVFDTITLTKTH